jgi:catechol 2,3-dioxygenase-like lactoylglutathione lyase family enzyme
MSSPKPMLSEAVREAVARARERPDDVALQIAAAYACDRAGDESGAVEFYDAAWRLGVPPADEAEFVVGYGSTLRNVGRTDDALAVLGAFIDAHPDNLAARCFRALALHSAQRPARALAELIDVALELHAASPSLTRYRRALSEYRDGLSAEEPFERVAPVLPVRDVSAALERYRRLGFEADAYCEGDAVPNEALIYGFLRRGNVSLHLTRVDALDPLTTTSAVFIYVEDADAVHAEWSRAGVEGRFNAPEATGYGMREFAYIDPDGNLLRVGSDLR